MAMQRSFAAGEIGPSLYGGADQARYQSALKTCRNFLVLRHGGVANRSGSEFIAEVKNSAHATRLFPFIFDSTDTYVIEAGDLYFRFYQNGAQVLLAGNPLEVVTPYVTADVAQLKMVQSGDVIVITHPGYQPRLLSRTGGGWTLTLYATAPSIAQPDGGSGAAGAVGTFTFRYKVTARKEETWEESLPGFSAPKTITGITAANPAVVSSTAHGYANGDEVFITGVVGMTQVNGLRFTVAGQTANTFQLLGINSTAYTAYSSAGTAQATSINVYLAADPPTPELPNTLAWTAVSGAIEYNVYLDKDGNGVWGFIGFTPKTAFNDVGYQPDFSVTPPAERIMFETANDRPASATYYQHRLMFGGTTNDPEDVFASRTGFFNNHCISSPIQDDDAIRFTIAGRLMNQVRHLIEVGKLVILTKSGEWIVMGDADGVLRPTAINLKQQSFYGASETTPAVIGNSILYVQARGGIVRDLRFDSGIDSYDGRDLTVFAPHLFEGYTIDQIAFQQIPNSILWCVRSDGRLLGLTYLREFDVFAWHRHDTDGNFESVCVIPETTPPIPGGSGQGKEEDYLYAIVARTGGRYVERFSSRRVQDYRLDGHFLDSYLTYNGINAGATTVTLTTAAGWTPADLITVTMSGSGSFVAGDVGNGVTVWTGLISPNRIVITQYISATVVKGNPVIAVVAGLQNTATNSWSLAVDTVSGADHLEGKTVSILANGAVLSGTVISGDVALGGLYDVVHLGLAIEADFESLPLDSANESIRDKKKLVKSVSLLVERSRGFMAGPDEDHLKNFRAETGTVLGVDVFAQDGATLLNDVIEVPIVNTWSKPGRVFVRQSEPLPLSILGLIANGEMER